MIVKHSSLTDSIIQLDVPVFRQGFLLTVS